MSGDLVETMRPANRSALAAKATLWPASLAGLAAICLVAGLLYWNAVLRAVVVWSDSSAYNHGFLILPIVLYLIWERRPLLTGHAPTPLLRALVLLPVLGLLWLTARLLVVLEAQQFLLIAMLQVVFLALLGRRIYSILSFPLLFLFFLVPSGDFLIPYLQDFTARFVVRGLELSGIPVFSDGFMISIPAADFYVAEACAGLRFLIATIAFGFLFADFALKSWTRRVVFVALCFVVPIIANGLRAYGIILIAYLSNGPNAVWFDHIIYGWVFFSLVTVVLFLIGLAMRDAVPARAGAAAAPGPPGTLRRTLAVAAMGLLLVALPRGVAAYLEQAPAATGPVKLALSQAPESWTAIDMAPDDWRPDFPKADAVLQNAYRKGAARVDFVIAYYRSQNEAKKLVSVQNHLDSGDWDISSRGTATLAIGGETIPVAATEIKLKRQKRLALSVYWVDGRFEANDLKAKLLQLPARLIAGRPEAAMVVLSTAVGDDGAKARAALADFAAHLGDLRPALLRAVGS
jgi:exosortase A